MIRHLQRNKSFTLIELLAVVMVILILAGIMFGVDRKSTRLNSSH